MIESLSNKTFSSVDPRSVAPEQDEARMTQEGVTSTIISWSYGEGNEGVFVSPTSSSDKVLIVGRGILWWGMVVARVNLRIHSILLSDTRFTSIVSIYFGSRIPIAKAVEQT
jgi:hypothetical protein